MTKQGMKWSVIFSLLAGLTLSGCGEDRESSSETKDEAVVKEDYYLTASPEVQAEESLIVALTSNIPGDIQVMVSVGLAGQAPDDIFVGTNERASLKDGHGEAVVQISEIPQGDYEVDATFYPRWGFKDGHKTADISEPIASEAKVLTLTGSGESSETYISRNEGQRWVMDNISAGTPWKPESLRARFGEWEEFPATKRNPDIIKNYYFPSIDMTIVVNKLKGEAVTWSKGREGL